MEIVPLGHGFEAGDELDILYKVVNEDPRPFPDEIGKITPAELLELIMNCLDKDPAKRPQSISEVQNILSSLQLDSKWTPEDARRSWELSPETYKIAEEPPY